MCNSKADHQGKYSIHLSDAERRDEVSVSDDPISDQIYWHQVLDKLSVQHGRIKSLYWTEHGNKKQRSLNKTRQENQMYWCASGAF